MVHEVQDVVSLEREALWAKKILAGTMNHEKVRCG